MLGRMKVFARLAGAFAFYEVDAHGHQTVLGVYGTMGGRMSELTLARLLRTITALIFFTYLKNETTTTTTMVNI